MAEASAIEHGGTRTGRWLRERRFKFALWIAIVEGILVVVDVIPWWLVFVVAAAAIVYYIGVGRDHGTDAMRQGSWIAAASQLLVVLVPVFVAVATALAVFVLVCLALVALALLFLDRR
jgi:hypothetical protein